MRPRSRHRPALVLVACALALGCDRGRKVTGTSGPRTTSAAPTVEGIPAERLDGVLSAQDRGLGAMEQFEYPRAVAEFRTVHALAPGWTAGAINLGIALLNRGGTDAGGQGTGSTGAFDEALDLFAAVLRRDPTNRHAHFCSGIILDRKGELAEAHRHFQAVADADPLDALTWYWLGRTLTVPGESRQAAGPKQAPELIRLYTRALELNPYLVPALFRLQGAYGMARDRAKQQEVTALWKRLNPRGNAAAPGEGADVVYGEMGRYATVIGPSRDRSPPAAPAVPPRFETLAPLSVVLPGGDRWATAADFAGRLAVVGRVRARFGAAVATFDADGDGKTDLFLAAAVVGPKGVRDALLLNRGGGRFADATRAFGLPEDRASLGVAAADFDADRHVDVFLTGVGDNRLYRNLGTRFDDVTTAAGIGGPPAVSLTARWLDLDQDGDLDLYVVNYTGAEHADEALTARVPPGLPNAAYRNDGKPSPQSGPAETWAPAAVASGETHGTAGLSIALTPWPDAENLRGGDGPHTAVAALDVDDDRDLDLVLAVDGEERPHAILNDRLGRFHRADLRLSRAREGPWDPIAGLLAADVDKDGRTDLVALGEHPAVWLNQTDRAAAATAIRFEIRGGTGPRWRAAHTVDLDLDGSCDLLGLPSSGPPVPSSGRFERDHLRVAPLALGPVGKPEAPLQGIAPADLVGDPLPDLVLVQDGEAPLLARNLGNGHHWLALDLGGRWRAGNENRMRTNPQALGTRVLLEGHGLNVPYDHTTPEASLAQSVGPVVLGLGMHQAVPLVRLRWPDGVLQCELNVPADQRLALAEFNRRTSSCPVLFTWNGARFDCVADFLGGGGLGYLLAPGRYGDPDRDEAVAIEPDQLRATGGAYRLAVAEPMDEVAYLDRLALEVVDRPPGVTAAPDERFAPGGRRPTGDLVAWRVAIEPVRATDLGGKDLGDLLHARDRRAVDGYRRLPSWVGYAEEHGIVLDFGALLARFSPTDPLVLVLAGWVDYPYSQTNYAAATAGVALRPPVLERRRNDGTWVVIEADPGYPAGLPRLTTLDLTGKLTGPRCVLRLRTNLDCTWDQAFVAVRDPAAGLRVTPVPLARASLGYRGYLREVAPDGRPPLLYDYDHIDPAPLAGLAGCLTRYGDVAKLLREDDDRLCLVGPGDEVRLEFNAQGVPPLPSGWTRGYVLRAIGYCKDADPFTGASDTVGPLPWRGMPAYPFGPDGERPRDPDYRAYLETYQTRPAGSR